MEDGFYRYVVAYRDIDGSFDKMGRPYVDLSIYEITRATKRANKLKSLGYKDIRIVRIPFVDELTWDYVKDNTVLEV